MSRRPTLVFVPGAWHQASTWDKVASLLEAKQFKCVCVSLPSTSSDPAATLGDDVQAVRDAIGAETAQGRDVVVVVHSYGGVVGASAIKGFARPKQADTTNTSTTTNTAASTTNTNTAASTTNTNTAASTTNTASAAGTVSAPGHVIGLALMATGFCATGLSFIDNVGGQPPPFWHADTTRGFAVLVTDPRELFYHDLPPAEAAACVANLRDHSLRSLLEGGEAAYAGWQDVPCWYLVAAEDRALPAEMQHLAVQGAREAGADVTLREVASSHSPMLSRPVETVEFLVDAATAFAG